MGNDKFSKYPINPNYVLNIITENINLINPKDLKHIKSDLIRPILFPPKTGKNSSLSASPTGPSVTSTIPTQDLIEKSQLIEKLATIGDLKATRQDVKLLIDILECFDTTVLRKLANAGYKIKVGRDSVANANSSLRAAKFDGITSITQESDGIHSVSGKERVISVRTKMESGVLQTNIPTLVHEIGHALDLLGSTKVTNPNVTKDIATADVNDIGSLKQFFDKIKSQVSIPFQISESTEFIKVYDDEHKKFSDNYFHTPKEFFAETYSIYCINPEFARSRFPNTCDFYKRISLETVLENPEKLFQIQKEMTPSSIVSTSPEVESLILKYEDVIKKRNQTAATTPPYIFNFSGDPNSIEEMMPHLGVFLLNSRDPKTPLMGDEKGFIEITPELAKDPKKFFADLSGTRGAILYIKDTKSIDSSHSFWGEFKNFTETHGPLCYLALSGDSQDREHIIRELQYPNKEIKIEKLLPNQIVSLIMRHAYTEGYIFEKAAFEKLQTTIKDSGNHSDAENLWVNIRNAQSSRIVGMEGPSVLGEIPEVQLIKPEDLNKLLSAKQKTALEELNGLTGLDSVKETIASWIASSNLALREKDAGIKSQNTNKNLFFAGNPGTGKTTVAKLLGQIAKENQLIKESTVVELTASSLMANGPASAISEFKKAKGGVIFIDEFHQLANSANGKEILDSLIPLLADKNWSDTIFVTAGYPDKILDVEKMDPGFKSRFQYVNFKDYERSQIREIASKRIYESGYIINEDALNALCDRTDRVQRSTRYPGNARDINKVIDLVILSRSLRLSKLSDSELSSEDLKEIKLEDVIDQEKPKIQDVMREIDQLPGNLEFKMTMKRVAGLVNRNKSLTLQKLDGIPMTIAISTIEGTNVKELAELASKLYSALDLLPNPGIVSETGGNLLGAFVGNSTSQKVIDAFDPAFGKTLLIERVSGVNSGATFAKQSADEIVNQIQTGTGKFLTIIADTDSGLNDFFKLNSELRVLFSTRIKMSKISKDESIKVFNDISKEESKKWIFETNHTEILEQQMNEIINLPKFRSKEDINRLASIIVERQTDSYAEKDYPTDFDWNYVSNDILYRACRDLITEIKTRGTDSLTMSDYSLPLQTQVAQRNSEQTRTNQNQMTEKDKKVLSALNKVNQLFSNIANATPDVLTSQQEDINSEYHQELAKEMGTDVATAKAEAELVKEKLAKIIETLEKSQKLTFVYTCPFCGGKNSDSCQYFGNSQMKQPDNYVYSTKWLMRNSLTPPEFIDEINKLQQNS